MVRFRNREDAGRRLAAELQRLASEHPIVLALPRGGVPVGYEVAKALGAPLDVWVVRKVGVPWHQELGMGAVAEGGYLLLSRGIIDQLGVTEDELSGAIQREQARVTQRLRKFRGARPAPSLQDRTVVLVDDGIATGGTVRAAIRAIRAGSPRRIVLAVPVASADTLDALAAEVDELVCLAAPENLYAIGVWYDAFAQVQDDDVVRLLELAREEQRAREQTRLALA